MPFDAQAYDLAAETDDVILSFGLAPTPANLCSMAAEMERRLRLHPGGSVQAARIVRELRRRAVWRQDGMLDQGDGSSRHHGSIAPAFPGQSSWGRV